jgi:hypothetical protein
MRNGRLLDEQLGNSDRLVNFTHFDAWLTDDDGVEVDLTEDDEVAIALRVLKSWDESCGTSIVKSLAEKYQFLSELDVLDSLVSTIGLTNVFRMACFHILEQGYDVYFSDNMVEIYSPLTAADNPYETGSLKADVWAEIQGLNQEVTS